LPSSAGSSQTWSSDSSSAAISWMNVPSTSVTPLRALLTSSQIFLIFSGGNYLGAFVVTNLLMSSICRANPTPTE
jgi:hypothetical protein